MATSDKQPTPAYSTQHTDGSPAQRLNGRLAKSRRARRRSMGKLTAGTRHARPRPTGYYSAFCSPLPIGFCVVLGRKIACFQHFCGRGGTSACLLVRVRFRHKPTSAPTAVASAHPSKPVIAVRVAGFGSCGSWPPGLLTWVKEERMGSLKLLTHAVQRSETQRSTTQRSAAQRGARCHPCDQNSIRYTF